MNQQISSEKLAVINGLRGVALLMVVFHHLPIHAWCLTRFPYILGNTNAGVNLFFILSGIVLFRPYTNRETPLNKEEVWTFYKKRFFRLYPLFFFNCLICLLFLETPSAERLLSAIKALTTYSLFFGNDFMPKINWVMWSLIMEIWFSILFPLVLWAICRFSIYKIAWIILITAFASRVLLILYPATNPFLQLFSRFDDFYLGFLLYKIYEKNSWPEMLKGWLGIGLGLVFLVAACLSGDLAGPLMQPIKYNLFQIGFAFLIMSALLSKNLFSGFLEIKGIQVLGMMCFSIYLWHGILIKQIIREEFHAIDYLWYSLALGAISFFTYRFIEFRKVESWKKLLLC